jgi:hypothetical protein
MSEMVDRMQARFKKSSGDVFTFSLKLFTGLVVGLVIALVAQEMLGHKQGEAPLSFYFIIAVVTAAFLRISKNWAIAAILVFDLVCILIGIILRLYITVAPGS